MLDQRLAGDPADSSSDDTPSGVVPTILEAIVRKLCVRATYNRGTALLAPHILYTRHDVLHIDAVTLLRDGKPPREEKIATYRLSGLSDVTRTDTGFVPSALFEPEAERYEGTALMAVERD